METATSRHVAVTGSDLIKNAAAFLMDGDAETIVSGSGSGSGSDSDSDNDNDNESGVAVETPASPPGDPPFPTPDCMCSVAISRLVALRRATIEHRILVPIDQPGHRVHKPSSSVPHIDAIQRIDDHQTSIANRVNRRFASEGGNPTGFYRLWVRISARGPMDGRISVESRPTARGTTTICCVSGAKVCGPHCGWLTLYDTADNILVSWPFDRRFDRLVLAMAEFLHMGAKFDQRLDEWWRGAINATPSRQPSVAELEAEFAAPESELYASIVGYICDALGI